MHPSMFHKLLLLFFLLSSIIQLSRQETKVRTVPSTTSLPSRTVSPSPTPTFLPPECPKGSTAYERTRACFWVLEPRMKWHEADRACGRQGGKLASIVDETENAQAFEVAHRANLTVQTVWLGKLSKVATTGAYEWHDGAVGRQSDGFKGLLIRDPPTTSDVCLTMWMDFGKPEGSWHEWDCNYSQGYSALCKKTYKKVEVRTNGSITPSNPLDDTYQAKRCCAGNGCGRRCATTERCIPDDMDCMWKSCTGDGSYGWCLPLP